MTKLTDFLAPLFPNDDEFIHLRAFKAKDAPESPDNRPWMEVVTRRRLATDANLQKRLAVVNKTRGLYFVVNSGGKTDAEITRFNAFFVENDRLPIDEQHQWLSAESIQPSLRVVTRKSVHAYWLIDGECGVEDWRDMQVRLAVRFDGDRTIKNPSRVMRLPFFNHVHYNPQTRLYEYKPVELHTFEPQRRYTLAEMQRAFPKVSQKDETSVQANGNVNGLSATVNLAPKVAEIIANGSRHRELLSLAGSMRRRGMSAEAMCAALKVTNETQCQPPLDEQEVVELCNDVAHRYAPEAKTKSVGSGPIEATPVKIPVLSEVALYGVAGAIVRTIEPHTEADNAALLFQLLSAFGNLIGKTAYFRAEADFHYTKINVVLVGQSSKGRKGSSWGHIYNLSIRVDETFKDCVQDGLSSGEGLIAHVRDPQEKKVPVKEKGRIVDYQTEIVDEGAIEKRAFIVEPEFARVLRAMQREGNTLSSVIRQAWDSDRLRVMTKIPLKASEAHISIVGHITQHELKRNLDQTETANGFANRFLWTLATRSKFLPEGGNLQESDLNPAVQALRRAVVFARKQGEIKRDENATKLWCEKYPELSAGQPGLFGAVTGRAEAQVMRIATIYALLDCSEVIRREHLEAAFAVWQYAEDSARYIFGNATGDKFADEIFIALVAAGTDGLTRTDISTLLGRNRSANEIERALKLLFECGKARMGLERTADAKRPTERWYALLCKNEINEVNEINPENEPEQENKFVKFVNFVEPTSEEPLETEEGALFATKPINERVKPEGLTNKPLTFSCWKCRTSCSSEDARCPNCDHDLEDMPF